MRQDPDKIGRLIYAAGEACADQLYASGVMTPDPFLWYQIGSEQAVIVSPLEYGRAKRHAFPSIQVLCTENIKTDWQLKQLPLRPELLIHALSERENITAWEVPADFPLGLAEKLAETGLTLHPVADFWPQRQQKRPDEIEKIREGVQLAERGLQRALQIIGACMVTAEGLLQWQDSLLSSETLCGEINAEITRYGGTAAHTIAAAGCQGADPHESGHGDIRAGQAIVIDIFPRVNRTGYHGDLTRTVLKGKAPQHVLTAFAAVYDAQQAAIRCAKAGIAAAKLHAKVTQCFDRYGFRTETAASPPYGFIHGTGHGLGLAIHEAPRVSDKVSDKLKAGHVITVEPGLYYPEWGGVRIEDVIVVTAEGYENLTSAPVSLEIP